MKNKNKKSKKKKISFPIKFKKKQNDVNDENVIYLNGSEEAKQRNTIARKNAARKKLFFVGVVIVVAIIAVVVVFKLLNREYKGYTVKKRISTSYENTANYEYFDGELLKYTPDGVSYINSNGDTVWSAGINMNMPLVVTSGEYAAIVDIGGNSVCIFSTEGLVSSLTMPYTICDVDIADQGAFAVVLESEKTNYINLYDKKGEIIYEMQTTIDKSGYPIDISISDDGEKLFTSYLKINGTSLENNLAAYNFGDVGQNSNADRIVGGYVFNDQIIPKLEFVNNDTVVAYGTSSIILFSMSEKPSVSKEIKLDKEVKSVFYSSKFFGYIQEADEGSDYLYDLNVYNLKGKHLFGKELDFEYTNVYAIKKELIVTGGDDCLIIRSNGHVKYDGKLSGNIENMAPSGGRLEYVVVYSDMTEIIKLKPEPQNNDDVKLDNNEVKTESGNTNNANNTPVATMQDAQ